jgi:tetratricopeptide (TPR) repeat protein
MTDNHLLLYRLASLMLEHEQHQLPVDMLFDDEHIGDFVKSIQIDSPYQQMLIEGVLTEYVRDEKLYVGFTVEGYFHYLLGEVIYTQTEVKHVNELKQIIEVNKLNGAKEGVEQCLIRDVESDNLERLAWMIDNGDDYLDICYNPLAQSFLIQKFNTKSDEDFYNAQKNQIQFVITNLFKEINQNDIRVIEKTIDYLYDQQKHSTVVIIYSILNEILKPDSDIKQAILSLNGICYFSPEFRLEKIKKIEKLKFRSDPNQIVDFYFSLGNEYRDISHYDEAMKMYRKSFRYLKSSVNSDKLLTDYYIYIGLICNYKENHSKAIIYFNKALKILSGNNPSKLSTCYNNLGATWDNKGNHKRAIYFLEKSLNLRLSIYGKNHPKTATNFNNLGLAYKNISKYKSALFYLEEALKVRIKVFGENHESTAVSLNNIGLAYRSAEKSSMAIAYFEKSLKIRLIIHGKYHPSTHLIYKNLIYTLVEIGQIEKAEEYFVDLNNEYNLLYSDSEIKMAEILETKSKILESKGEYVEAINCLEKSLEFHFNESDSTLKKSNIAHCCMKIGDIWCQVSDYEKAIEKYEIALQYRLDQHEEDGTDIHLSLIYENIGTAWEQIGDTAKALEYYKKALEINLDIHGEHHVATSTNYLNLASLFESQKDFENALVYYEKCLEIDLLTIGDKHPYTRASYVFIGRVLRKLNNHDRALHAFGHALAIDIIHHGVNHEDTLSDYKMIASCWLEKGNIQQARENIKKALEISKLINGEDDSETTEINDLIKSIETK